MTDARNLVLGSIKGTNKKSILLSTYISNTEQIITAIYIALIDIRATGKGFINYSFAIKNRLPLFRLERERSLYLADGIFKAKIRYFTQFRIQIGQHIKILALFVTTLSKDHPIILGLD